jgi:hypothetical protein
MGRTGSLEHPLHRRLDSTSATGRTPQRTAGIGTYQVPGRERAAERHGRRLRTHRDLGRERAADSTYRRIYLRPSLSLGPNRARTGGGPKELLISEQLGILSRQVTTNVSLQSRTDLRHIRFSHH